MSDSIVQTRLLVIPEGKCIRLEDETTKQRRPNYRMIGNGTMNRHQVQSIDLITEMVTLSRPAISTLACIQQHLTWDNHDGVVRINMSDFNSAGQQSFQKGFKELHSRGLAKRIRRSHYMINPNALIPVDYDSAARIWDIAD